ncbi:unnamed protein product [Sphagnum balticum]
MYKNRFKRKQESTLENQVRTSVCPPHACATAVHRHDRRNVPQSAFGECQDGVPTIGDIAQRRTASTCARHCRRHDVGGRAEDDTGIEVCSVWPTHTPLQGLLNSDRHLAAALWRQLYDSQTNIDVHKLNALVRYVRRTVCAFRLMGHTLRRCAGVRNASTRSRHISRRRRARLETVHPQHGHVHAGVQ